MSMSFMVQRSEGAYGPVEATIATFGDEVAAVMKRETDPFVPEGSTNTDYRFLMDTQLSVSSSALAVVVAKGKVYNRTKPKKNQLGGKFRGVIDSLATSWRKFRSTLEEHHGPDILVAINSVRPLRSRHIDTLTDVETMLEHYRGLDMSLFPEVEGMGSFDAEARTAWLDTLLERCRKRKKEYELAVKENDKARNALEDSYGDFRRLFSNSTQVIQSLFRMAGYDEQADRLRYLVSRTSRALRPKEDKEEDQEGKPPAEGATADAATAASEALTVVDSTAIIELS
jgi:hypothetical protein